MHFIHRAHLIVCEKTLLKNSPEMINLKDIALILFMRLAYCWDSIILSAWCRMENTETTIRLLGK